MSLYCYRASMPLPSVLLHDHLDGGLRPLTVLELADEASYQDLPASDVAELARWFDQSESGSLEHYLEAFDHTVAVMQTSSALERVAYEAVIDLSADGVVYAEIRFCPPHHAKGDLSHRDVVEAVASGMSRGASETGLEWGLIIDSLRHLHRADDLARLAAACTDLGVVGFDLAGPEHGYPPREHLPGFAYARANGLGVSIHAGEAGREQGVAYMAESVDVCHAHRIGHGVEIVNDCRVVDGEIVGTGPVASRIRDQRTPLEMCSASNVATSAISPEEHPFGMLYRAGFNVLLNTDNRLMSATSMSLEFEFARAVAGLDDADLAAVTRSSLDAAFCGRQTKSHIWSERIVPGFADAGIQLAPEWI